MKQRVRRHGMVFIAALVPLTLVASGLVASSAGAAVGSPSAPRAVHATGTATSVSVKWARPASIGATPIREYVVTSKPSAKSCVTKTTTCVVTGLRLGSSYTFSVIAKNGNGASIKSTSNRIKVAKASTYFNSQLAVFGSTSSSAETALNNAHTAAAEQSALRKLTDSFDSFIAALKLERWPSSTTADMASFLTDTRQLATDTVTSLQASTVSAAEDYDVLQSVTGKVLLVEANIFTDLGFPSPISPPYTVAPTPAAINTAQTIHDLYGDSVSVTATQLVDPAIAAAGSGLPDAGYRFVAVQLSLNNQSTSVTIQGDANYSTTVTGSDGQTYSADYGTVSECANFEYGEFQLPPGNSAAGCVLFELPTSVTVKTIQFTLAPSYLDVAQWNS
jgi:hypothetical protein